METISAAPRRVARTFLFLVALSIAAWAQAYTYDVAPAPALPSPPVLAPATAALSPATSPIRGAALLYLAPFTDRRPERALWKGNGRFEAVGVEAEGLSGQAEAWSRGDYASISFLWHRQLGQALAGSGFRVLEALPIPVPSSEREARSRGARYLLHGEILGLTIDKRGSDRLFGTNFSGTDYLFSMEALVAVEDLASGRQIFNKDWTCARGFHDPTRLGRRDRDTFPVYFVQGLDQAARDFAEDADFRAAAGFPPLPSPSPAPQDQGKPYWVNPKTGKRMDPSWNFDPSDGTPRKDFVLRQPETTAGGTP